MTSSGRVSSESRSCGLTARPTTQTAPGRRSIQRTMRSSWPASSTPDERPLRVPSVARAASHPPGIQSRPVAGVQEHVLVPLPASSAEEHVARYVIREHDRGRSLDRDPRGQVRPEPPHARAAAAPARPAGDHRVVLAATSSRRPASKATLSPGRAARPTAPSRRPARARGAPPPPPSATSQAAMPFDLKTTMSSSDWRPGDLARDDLVQLVHLEPVENARPATGSMRSPDSSLACSSQSQQTNAARSSTTLSSSRRLDDVRARGDDERARPRATPREAPDPASS